MISQTKTDPTFRDKRRKNDAVMVPDRGFTQNQGRRSVDLRSQPKRTGEAHPPAKRRKNRTRNKIKKVTVTILLCPATGLEPFGAKRSVRARCHLTYSNHLSSTVCGFRPNWHKICLRVRRRENWRSS